MSSLNRSLVFIFSRPFAMALLVTFPISKYNALADIVAESDAIHSMEDRPKRLAGISL